MARTADTNSKSKRIVFIPLTLEEEQISDDVKKLAIQDGLQVHDLMLEAIKLLFKVHHWPPGNPQLTLQNYSLGKQNFLGKCSLANCSNNAIIEAVNVQTKKEYKFCKKHFTGLPSRHDPKVWRLMQKPVSSGLEALN